MGSRSVGGRRPAGVLLVATRNEGKLAELRPPIEALGYDVIDLRAAGVAPSPEEDEIEVHATFEQNALAKARYYEAASGGLPTLADDSGLAVDALGGAPGVLSRRWAGATGPEAVVSAANNAKLLQLMTGVPSRAARFVCAIAYSAGSDSVVAVGEAHGRIAHAHRGSAGFGYDSLFEAEALGWRTYAEATEAEKAAVSHRGRALEAIVRRLGALGAARTG